MRKDYAIGMVTLIIGWLPMVFINLIGNYFGVTATIIAFAFGIFCCLFGALVALSLGMNNEFWMSLEDIRKERRKMIDARIEYNAAKKKLEQAALKVEN